MFGVGILIMSVSVEMRTLYGHSMENEKTSQAIVLVKMQSKNLRFLSLKVDLSIPLQSFVTAWR